MTNSVISKPTLFKFANGGTLGAVAEAGRSEAILPLERTSGGDLGVKASVDSGGVKNVKVEIINESGQQVQATSSTSQMDAGNLVVQIVIDAINRNKNGLRDIVGSV
jgi:phage-related minor tail protein